MSHFAEDGIDRVAIESGATRFRDLTFREQGDDGVVNVSAVNIPVMGSARTISPGTTSFSEDDQRHLAPVDRGAFPSNPNPVC